GCGAGLIGGLAMVTYYAVVTTPVIAVALTLLLALSWGVVVSLARRPVVNSTHWTQVFAYPVLWAAHDTLLAAISPPGSAATRGLGEPLWDVYARTVETLATRGARIVVLPEKIEVAGAAASPALQRRLGQPAARHGVHLVVGITVLADGRKENRAWLFASTGALAVDYLKQHLIPGLEGAFTPGREDAVHRLGTDSPGVALCKAFAFPALA